MVYQEIKTNNKYLDHFIAVGLNKQFALSLAPAQLEVLKTMLTHDYVLFRHGRAVGATFLLATLSVILRLVDPDINMAVASATIRQAKLINSEVESKFNKYGLEPNNIVSIEKALSGKYDVLLLDEITHLPNEYIESLINHIENTSISKIVAVCSGYRRYFPIAKLESTMYKGHLNPHSNRILISKNYEDMPLDFFDLNNLEEAKKMFDYPEEFDMEYKGYIL